MFAAIYIPDFPLQAILRAEPELRDQPTAVLDGKPPVLTVLAANDHATEAGIESGLTALEASTGLPAIELRRRSAAQETAAHAALLDCAQAFSPRVEDTAADTLVLDLSGLDLLFGTPVEIACDLVRRASECGLETNVAVAANPDAAVHAARGFAGTTVIALGKEAERLGKLPIDVLLRDNSIQDEKEAAEFWETLDRWGVRTFGALAALPEVALSERLGQVGLRLHRLARGLTQRAIVPAEPPLNFEETIELEYPVATLEPLAFILGRLLEQLCTRLRARALATNELRLVLKLDPTINEEATPPEHGDTEDQVPNFKFQVWESDKQSIGNTDLKLETVNSKLIFKRTLRLPVPMLDSRIFLKLLQLDLKAHPPAGPVLKVTLAAEPVAPRRSQAGLFIPVSPEPERLELTLARLRGITGEERVGSVELLDTNCPDAFRMVRFAPATLEGLGSALAKPRSATAPTLVLRRFRPAVSATVKFRNGEPVRISSHDNSVQGEVISCAGPWRMSGDWWNLSNAHEKNGVWMRDEWDIAVIDSSNAIVLYRIYCDLTGGQWRVEGTYD